MIPLLDSLPKIQRLLDVPLRMPISDKYKDMGTVVFGKLQSGHVKKGQKLIVMPNKQRVTVDGISIEEDEVDIAFSGDNVRIKLKDVEEEQLQSGYVLCPVKKPCSVCTTFDAQLVIMEWKSIIAPGGCRGSIFFFSGAVLATVSVLTFLFLIPACIVQASKQCCTSMPPRKKSKSPSCCASCPKRRASRIWTRATRDVLGQ